MSRVFDLVDNAPRGSNGFIEMRPSSISCGAFVAIICAACAGKTTGPVPALQPRALSKTPHSAKVSPALWRLGETAWLQRVLVEHPLVGKLYPMLPLHSRCSISKSKRRLMPLVQRTRMTLMHSVWPWIGTTPAGPSGRCTARCS